MDKTTALENEINKLFEQLSLNELEFDEILSKKQDEINQEKMRNQTLAKQIRGEFENERAEFQREKMLLTTQVRELRDALSENQRYLQKIEEEHLSLIRAQHLSKGSVGSQSSLSRYQGESSVN